MCHKPELLCFDGFNFKAGQLSTMAYRALVAFAAFIFVSDQLLALVLINDLGHDFGPCH